MVAYIVNRILGAWLRWRWAFALTPGGPRWSSSAVHCARRTLLERRRIELADSSLAGSVQPFHAAEGWELSKAERLIGRFQNASWELARRAIRDALRGLRDAGHTARKCGLLLASGRPLPSLEKTLASHALVHTADGEFFRDAIVRACELYNLHVVKLRERGVYELAATAFQMTPAQLRRRIADLGRETGPPWREDQKLASLVAWMALRAKARFLRALK